ncbi:MAG: D-alanine--D-alanine ligase [Flavobacteriales bacterium]|nr:MAG: D-alanine--D-alanine ligase [Flavobacteriales bacterium]
MKNIAIIEGGYSHEKIISLQSAEMVYQHIDREKYNPIKVRIDKQGWFAFDGDEKVEIDRTDFSFNNIKFEIAFIVIHGTPGEDGKLQAYFDMLDIPYSTCSHLAATLTFNKFVCNQYLKTFGIKVANAILVRENEPVNTANIVAKVGLPCFVKPNDGGSSFGITKVQNESELKQAVEVALEHGTQAIVESFMEGREVTNGIYRNKDGFVALPITEIVTTNDFFDFDAKYKGESDEITPADLTEEMNAKVKSVTQQIVELLDMNGIARADYIIQNGEPYLIEINTVPGLSKESLIPQMAAHEGIPLQQLFNEVLEVAIKKYRCI